MIITIQRLAFESASFLGYQQAFWRHFDQPHVDIHLVLYKYMCMKQALFMKYFSLDSFSICHHGEKTKLFLYSFMKGMKGTLITTIDNFKTVAFPENNTYCHDHLSYYSLT